ncbi:hypothetical protein FB45DRAFT_892924 [Roridomyces roridus]|uniref:SEC7 domain-containing protein n=1 Tax=Roridomyces roridus TaxID=1738132 RepID=A0AAD7FWR9_9AGAR|nr:hypothetical protein FB45DRAFT_892924 [Roridomyces roridus]
MEPESSMSEQREQRMLAVAKLKRAASLPRMKDGRRPPMHVEAVSEGEKVNTDDERKDELDTPPSEPRTEEPMAPTETSANADDGTEDATITIADTSTRTKRRSRSRTRSRGSKDLKHKARAALSPAPSPHVPSDSSQDEGASPSMVSPNLANLARNSKRGLFRSNSVGSASASRIMAMHKLTGGTEAYDPSPSPTPPPLPAKLGGRIAKEGEGEPTSGGEEYTAPSPTPKRRRRRSRRGSAGANTGVSDSDFVSTTPNTPIVPPTPLPVFEGLPDLRSLSRAASPPSALTDREEEPFRIALPVSARESPLGQERPEPTRRRSVVVEEEDEERVPIELRSPVPPVPPPQLYDYAAQVPIFSDLFGGNSRSSPALYSSRRPTPDYQARSSPFNVPLLEKQARDDDEEEVLYPADSYHSRNTYDDDFERQISWVGLPRSVPEIRMPIDDDEADDEDAMDEEDEEEEYEARPSVPRNASHVPPSPTSMTALSQKSASIVRTASEDSTSPQSFPARLSVASRTQDRSPLNAEFEWEDGKRTWDGGSTSTWDKIKGTFRSGSAAGRRSRTNSIVTRDRRDHTDSSVSRESGASLTGSKTDKGESAIAPVIQPPALMQSSSASASVVSLSPGVSLFPAASSADLLKYQNAKLFPFPGMKKLEEQRRAKGMLTPSASTPDISTLFNGYETDPAQNSAPNGPSQTSERDRKISHQASDTRLLDKYNASSPSTSTTLTSPTATDYFHVPAATSTPTPTTPSSGSKLPMTLPGVKQWLSSRKMFQTSSPGPSSANSPSEPGRPSPSASKKPSLSDLILRKDSTLGKDWEDVEIVPLSASDSIFGKSTPIAEPREMAVSAPPSQTTFQDSDREKTPKIRKVLSPAIAVAIDETSFLDFDPPSSALPSPPDPLSSTPDPLSSLSDYPAPSTSESSSTTSSHYSFAGNSGSQASFILERLEENLARGSRSPMWASAIDDPPRKLLLSSPVLQVVNPNTVKDRFLFLFSDILIIAKPVVHDQDNIIDSYKPTPMDRKFMVKSVVLLNQLRFNADRTDLQPKASNYSAAPRNPMIRAFVLQFGKEPDHAISTLLSKSGTPDDPIVLGQLLFKTLDLDRARLGDYLSRRTSKVVLKAYVDSFRFIGVRVDKALRAFLLSINIPSKMVYNVSALDYLLDAFASRWYEANARIVAYDKDLALNEFLHGGISHQPGPTGYPKRSISSRDFIDAFRRYDTRYLDAFHSIRDERLCQARLSLSNGPADISIMIKRPLPTRLTYKMQSDPIILRIQQADPDLTIQLLGQDLVSSEASFRTVIMCRSGPNALNHSLVVERAFMRNTFELAFLNHNGTKRRYMFSVDDPIIRHQWAVSLKREIDNACANSAASLSQTSPGPSKFHRAAEIVAFKALQQTLMAAIHSALQRLNANGSPPRALNNSAFRFPPDQRTGPPKLNLHVRSKSRSKVYHRGAAVKDEFDDQDLPSRNEGPMQCQQNSSIPLVLAFLQVGAPEHGR